MSLSSCRKAVSAVVDAVILVLLAIVAALFSHASLAGRTLRTGPMRVSWCALDLSALSYSRGATTISVVHLRLALHRPRPGHLRCFSLDASEYAFADDSCTVAIAAVAVALRLFPARLRASGGPPLHVELRDFRLRIPSSRTTPAWVERLRRNLVGTVLAGTVLRLDDFRTKLTLQAVADAPGAPEETRVDAAARGLHIVNAARRVYTFGKLDAQLRRAWGAGRGAFVLIAEEGRWTLAPPPTPPKPGFRPWVRSVLAAPAALVSIMRDPLASADLYVPRADITFDDFRIRDAELVQQGGRFLITEWDRARRSGALKGLGTDLTTAAIRAMLQ